MAYQQPGYNPQYQNAYPPPNQGWQQPQQPGWQQPQQQGVFVPPPPMPHMMPPQAHNAENGDAKYTLQFNDASIRAAFVRKVFALVCVMLAVVTVMTALPFMHRPLMTTIRTSPGLYFGAYIVFLSTYLTLMCCDGVRRAFPGNLIITAIFTFATGYLTMAISARYSIESVLLCLIICTVCCGAIIIFATTTKHDLTSMMGILFILSMCLLVFGLIAIFATMIFHVKFLYTIYAALAALLFMFYLAVDVQMMMGGRKYAISPEDHIYAAVQLFIDIVYIFWMLLSLFGSSK